MFENGKPHHGDCCACIEENWDREHVSHTLVGQQLDRLVQKDLSGQTLSDKEMHMALLIHGHAYRLTQGVVAGAGYGSVR